MKKFLTFLLISISLNSFGYIIADADIKKCEETACSLQKPCTCGNMCNYSTNKCDHKPRLDNNTLDEFYSLSPEGQTLLLLQIEDFQNKCDEIQRLSDEEVLEKINNTEK